MKLLAVLGITLAAFAAPTTARADKALEKNGAWDCKKDPVAHIGNGAGKYRFTGPCKLISVGGGENTLTIESVDTLDVGGAKNKITVGTVGTIDVGGADNTITWKKAKAGDKPILKGQPDKNTITQGK
ncbi:MAG: DUF3060 domain-containing protein [Deltaproteobacteria bacterium]|nr:MAG: DUF3060 domain-containing protein [Deltaproteobacteria bacterium]TMQ25404.1 MAG: DUF3060 domain-containing protein [Deltaproteobacteria bacterium]